MKRLGKYLKNARAARGIKMHELAESAGITRDTMLQVERGKEEPDEDVLRLMASALGEDVSVLYRAAGKEM